MKSPESVSVVEPLESAPLGEVLEFMRLLWAVDHGLQRTSKRMLGERGITGPQRLVLRVVGRYPSISAGQLAAILHLHPSTLTGVLERLRSRGLISRSSDPFDARRAVLGLTEKGRAQVLDSQGTVEEIVRSVLESASRAQINAVREVLNQLATRLQATGEATTPPAAGRSRSKRPRRDRS